MKFLEFVSAPLIPEIPATSNGNDEENDNQTNGSFTGEAEKLIPRAWWFSKSENTFSSKDVTEIATGFEESVKVVDEFIKENGPFDGLLGFSQGASMAHLLICLHQRKEFQRSFKFIILVSAFKSLSSVHNELVKIPITGIPSFHVCGLSDEIVFSSRSEDLAHMFSNPNPIIVKHNGGHCIPPMSAVKKELIEFLSQFKKI
uniref:Serine hydrolase FSH domain-containing protein n=1 Tax=Acrobeloides nanus TaxID=290746 RepID=A0A914D279_9BILA